MPFDLSSPQGVTSKDRAILKMRGVNFKYPTAEKHILNNVNVQVSLNSRIAVLGPNGAGKSTQIRLLTGELEAESGLVWKHPNLRVAYVAQHAFHHIENHLDMTPNQYIQWRYATGEDRESQDKVSRKVRAGRRRSAAWGCYSSVLQGWPADCALLCCVFPSSSRCTALAHPCRCPLRPCPADEGGGGEAHEGGQGG